MGARGEGGRRDEPIAEPPNVVGKSGISRWMVGLGRPPLREGGWGLDGE